MLIGVTFHAPGRLRVWENVRIEPPHSQVNSQFGSWTLESFGNDCRGQNPWNWRVFYIIEKVLERRCRKWAHMTQLYISNTSYDQKKGQESIWQFDSRPLKVGNHPDSLAFRWRATYCWKALDEGYNFALDLISIGGLHRKLCAPKVAGDLTLRILGQNAIWMLVPWACTKYTIRGKVVASPKSKPWWILWVRICP
jgi:hypothetical protein